jgi:small multidrug resistance pump
LRVRFRGSARFASGCDVDPDYWGQRDNDLADSPNPAPQCPPFIRAPSPANETVQTVHLRVMPVGVLLTMAIAVEVAATISLRYSDGFTKPLPSVLVVIGYATSFFLLSLILRDLSVGTTYAIWAGAGTAAIAVIGIVALGEPATALKLASIALIVAGVIGLNLSGAH